MPEIQNMTPRTNYFAWTAIGLLCFIACVMYLTPWKSSSNIRLPTPSDTSIGPLLVAIDTFRLDVGRYPKELRELNRKLGSEGADKWCGPYLKDDRRLQDSWGHQFQYQAPGQVNKMSYDLWSAGPDGNEGTDDDVTNFDKPRTLR